MWKWKAGIGNLSFQKTLSNDNVSYVFQDLNEWVCCIVNREQRSLHELFYNEWWHLFEFQMSFHSDELDSFPNLVETAIVWFGHNHWVWLNRQHFLGQSYSVWKGVFDKMRLEWDEIKDIRKHTSVVELTIFPLDFNVSAKANGSRGCFWW